ncbi:MAG: ATP-dependent endonuclease [Bacteroidetes bacterium RIFCSPLOWO2_12_FULL_31_6]|nr:MAG: ATP-dependent endonuclease [Bacteroidetes bacterium RIFCSPLOWO2_12_FULL_31_6]
MHNLFHQALLQNFGYPPTKNQLTVVGELTDFVFLKLKKHLFVLKGYAGTGKTSLVGALVKTLPQINFDSVLLAPTGRAAKVLSIYANKPAFTIHKMIYQLSNGGDGYTRFVLKQNKFQNTIFLVDEASMIGDGGGLTSSNWGENKSLLDDLLEFVYAGINCKLILIGDTAQLPPVGMDVSPALDEEFLRNSYHLNIELNELSEVVRQEKDSEILTNATYLRDKIAFNNVDFPLFNSINKDDVKQISGLELEDELNDAYTKFGEDNVMLITRSNKNANLYNLQIRARIKWLEDEIASGDYMMIVKNNYYWLEDSSKAGFIANGDIVEILKIRGIEELYGFKFANVTVRMIDYPDEKELEVKILMNSILSESPSLPSDRFRQLYDAVAEEYDYEPNRKKRNELIRKNPYYQALQVKFAYAITCHKSQGGQWDAVFIDQGYLTDEMINVEYLRWLYTAITRAKKELFLVNFSEQFFQLSS